MSVSSGGVHSVQNAQVPYPSETEAGQSRSQAGLGQAVQQLNSAKGASLNQDILNNASLDALMLAVMSERAEILESALRTQVDEVRGKNNKLKEANGVLAQARAAKKGSDDEDKTTAMPGAVRDFFATNGIPWGDGGGKIDPNGSYSLKASEWDLAIENMKGWTESLTSTSQLDMTKLQSTSGKFNQTFEMMSQFIAKYYRSGDNLIRNI